MLGGLVYEIIKIYSEKFTTNNSENNYKLSYTPKPPNPPSSPEPFQKHPSPGKLIQTSNHPFQKNNKQKKADSKMNRL
jgi:hypothetical protein